MEGPAMEQPAYDTGAMPYSPMLDTADCLRTALARALEQIALLEDENRRLMQAANHVTWLTAQ